MSIRTRSAARAWILGLLFAAGAQAQSPVSGLQPVTDEDLLHPKDADWLMWRRTYDGWGYSPLQQIEKSNVKDLQVAWTWSLTPGATETTPLIRDGVMFVHNNGDKVQALDGATGELLWEYSRALPSRIRGSASNQLTKRNMAIYGDNLLVATSDTHLIALNIKTGAVVWDHAVEDWDKGWRYSGGPMIADGKLIQGMTGCGNGEPGGCFITAHDPANGTELWRLHTIAQAGAEGNTWNGLPFAERYGASVWLSGTYDPAQKLLFYGVGQPYAWAAVTNGLLPASKEKGVGNNALYTDSTLAIEPQSGKLRWYFQHLQMDTWDLDYAFERTIVDLPVKGVLRKQVITVGKLGIVESLDRISGKWLWGKETVPQNVVKSIDEKTGHKTINEAVIPQIGKTTMNCPADPGARGWPATGYSPKTQALYIPLNEFCANATVAAPEPGQTVRRFNGGVTFARVPNPAGDGDIGRVDAVRLSDRSTSWSVRQRAPITSALLPTAGGIVFGGDLARYFRAYDDETGQVLWRIRTNNVVNGFPVSYGVNGRQYIAVVVGSGSTTPRALNSVTPEIANPEAGSVLWVFALPDGK